MFIMYFALPLSEIMRQIENSEINDSLEFQRDFVWPKKKQQDLITTYQNKKGFGIVSFCRHSASEIWGILDGKQRATTFIRFIKGEFKDRHGKTFAEWSEGEKMRLHQLPIQICGYTLDTTIEDHSDLVEQFVLLNNSGQKLVDAELIYACNAPIRRYAELWFHSPLAANIVDEDGQLREKWCQVFRNPEHFTRKLDIKTLKQICGEHALDTGGKKFDLIARIEGNEGALIALRNHRSKLNDGIIPVTEQTRKNQYAITVPMMASACLNNFEAITSSFNKLKKSGAFGAEILSDIQNITRFRTCVNHWLNWVELQRNIEMPDKYKINHPKFGIPTLGKVSISWAICLGSSATEDEDIEFRTQCIHLFDDGNFAPLQVFYSKLSTDLRWQFDVVQQASRGSMKQWITNSVAFIRHHCSQ